MKQKKEERTRNKQIQIFITKITDQIAFECKQNVIDKKRVFFVEWAADFSFHFLPVTKIYFVCVCARARVFELVLALQRWSNKRICTSLCSLDLVKWHWQYKHIKGHIMGHVFKCSCTAMPAVTKSIKCSQYANQHHDMAWHGLAPSSICWSNSGVYAQKIERKKSSSNAVRCLPSTKS